MVISIDDFKKVEIKVGEIMSAVKIENSDKLLCLKVNFGLKPQLGSPDPSLSSDLEEKDIRQVISGISKHFENPEDLVGKKCAFATNLEPRQIMGLLSEAMILAVSGDNFFSLLSANENVAPGSAVK